MSSWKGKKFIQKNKNWLRFWIRWELIVCHTEQMKHDEHALSDVILKLYR